MSLDTFRNWGTPKKIISTVISMLLLNVIVSLLLMLITGMNLDELTNPEVKIKTIALAEKVIINDEVDVISELKGIQSIIKETPPSELNKAFYLFITVNLFSYLGLGLVLIYIFFKEGLKEVLVNNKTPVLFIASVLLAYHIPKLGSDALRLNEYLKLDLFQNWLFNSDLLSDTIKSIGEMIYIMPNDERGYLITFIGICLIPAIGEELLFRGLLMRLFSERTNIHNAIAIQALLFAGVHFNLTNFLYYFVLGVVLGYLYYWGRNIAFPMVVHLINNFLVLFNYFVITTASKASLNNIIEEGVFNDAGVYSWMSYLTIALSLGIFYMNFNRNRHIIEK